MKLHIAGGCGEHGRNCFHVETVSQSFLVDCGMMAAAQDPWPHLPPECVPELKAVFLTHSHADHSGALNHIAALGFRGLVVGSEPTLAQLRLPGLRTLPLESLCPDGAGMFNRAHVQWGRSGHCPGSVWYRFEEDGSILFSGDYTENTQVFACDPIRGVQAERAVIDCAHGRDDTDYATACDMLAHEILRLLRYTGCLFFPVPCYGRGEELLYLLRDRGLFGHYLGDAYFVAHIEEARRLPFWYRRQNAPVEPLEAGLPPEREGRAAAVFISDPQLRRPASLRLAHTLLAHGAYGVLTGTVEVDTPAAALLAQGGLVQARYPVHLNHAQYRQLCVENSFAESIPYHSADFPAPPDCLQGPTGALK